MATIKLTIFDHENGSVKIDCDPPVEKLLQIAKDNNATPAEIYAFIALGNMMRRSNELDREQSESRLTIPESPRFKLGN